MTVILAPRSRIPVTILGATGTVGQKLIALLADHPWFELVALAASDQRAGRLYGEVVRWREPAPLPEAVARMPLARCAPPLPGRVAFSALDASVAAPIEQSFAAAGVVVVTNTRNHRMDPDVPLLVPDINPDHLDLLPGQRAARGWPGGGAIVANPNCSTAGLVTVLAPLHRAFGVDRVFVSTMQAISGAGYPGVPSLDILGNVIPFISGEEEKIEQETCKILGGLSSNTLQDASIRISAHTHRVPVIDGHLIAASIGFGKGRTPGAVREVLLAAVPSPELQQLPSTPARILEVDDRDDRPQPRLDRDRGRGMTVTVGRIRPCPILDVRLVLLVHNTIRGAAGLAVQDAELLVARGVIP